MSRPQVLSISGGKDSTWMLLDMLKRGERIDAAVMFDWGKEFPEMAEHLALLEKTSGVKIIRVYPTYTWGHEMLKYPMWVTSGIMHKGEDYWCIGRGWPSPTRPWCRRIKARMLDRFIKANWPGAVQCIGFAADEQRRLGSVNMKRKQAAGQVRYPLMEYGLTEGHCLRNCLAAGFTWGGLYDVFDRVSCYLCPLGGLRKARLMRKRYPGLWAKILELDSRIIGRNLGFDHYASAEDLDARFANEDRQTVLTVG